MKRSLIAVVVALTVLLPIFAFAAELEKKEEQKDLGFWFETQAVGNTKPWKAIGWYEPPIKGQFGFFMLAEYESDGYRSTYIGPTWKPFSWFRVGAGLGAEQSPEDKLKSVRGALFFEIDRKKFNIFAMFENGGTGPWHKVTATYKATEKIGFGGMSETELGIGPRIEYKLRKNVQLWGAILHDNSTKTTTPIFAVNFSF